MVAHQPLLDAYLRSGTDLEGVDRSIAPGDPLLRFLDRLHHQVGTRALVDYFRGGWSVHRLLRQLLRLRFGTGAHEVSILDFGSGFGRTTRFLVREHRRDRITIADVMADAVAYQREAFGVAGQVSSPDPDQLDLAGRFDVVEAISVFTHFHPDHFTGWLERLLATLAPGGLLVFTVNDERTLLPGRSLEESGAWFESTNENDRLDPRRYGSTWVSETFVARALAAAADEPLDYRRVARGLWASQDVYVVAAPGGGVLPDPLPLLLEPAGVLEQAAVGEDGTLRLRGWASMPDGAPVAKVEATIDGHGTSTIPVLPRPDVAARFAPAPRDEAAATPGWQLVLEPPAAGFAPEDVLAVTATSRDGVAFAIEHDHLTGSLEYLRLDALHRRIAELEHEVRRRDLQIGKLKEIEGALWWGVRNRHFELKALEGELAVSRFWKLRNHWWSLKRRLAGR